MDHHIEILSIAHLKFTMKTYTNMQINPTRTVEVVCSTNLYHSIGRIDQQTHRQIDSNIRSQTLLVEIWKIQFERNFYLHILS